MMSTSPKSMSGRGSLLARPDPEWFRSNGLNVSEALGVASFQIGYLQRFQASTRVQPAIRNATPLRSGGDHHLSPFTSAFPLPTFPDLLFSICDLLFAKRL